MGTIEKLLKKYKKLVREIALRNQNGHIVISKNDSWVLDDSWDELYLKVSDKGYLCKMTNISATKYIHNFFDSESL